MDRALYQDTYRRMFEETAVVVFIKANGKFRVMLATRNMDTVRLLKHNDVLAGAQMRGHDNRCNINNGNMSVIDLEIGEGRSFNVDRLIKLHWFGVIDTEEKAENCLEQFKEFSKRYNEASMSLEDINL